jgi:hypothetical protein
LLQQTHLSFLHKTPRVLKYLSTKKTKFRFHGHFAEKRPPSLLQRSPSTAPPPLRVLIPSCHPLPFTSHPFFLFFPPPLPAPSVTAAQASRRRARRDPVREPLLNSSATVGLPAGCRGGRRRVWRAFHERSRAPTAMHRRAAAHVGMEAWSATSPPPAAP